MHTQAPVDFRRNMTCLLIFGSDLVCAVVDGEILVPFSCVQFFAPLVYFLTRSVQLDVKPDTARSLPQLPLAKDLKSVRPGHFVLALGSPLMLANSVTVGVVSALDRDLGHSEGLKYIQTDAIITVSGVNFFLVNSFPVVFFVILV